MKHTNKTERIYLRVSSEEKEQIKANASNMDMEMSDYIRKQIIQSKSNNICCPPPHVLCAIQTLLNDIQEKYGYDPEIEQKIDNLWDNL